MSILLGDNGDDTIQKKRQVLTLLIEMLRAKERL